MQALSRGLPSFKNATLLVLGDLMLDRYWLGDTTRVSPEAPVPIVNVQQHDERPGGAANVACNVQALGASVIVVGVIGDDEAGRILLNMLNTRHIQTDVYQAPALSTIVKLRVLSKHQQLLRMDFEKPYYLDEAAEAQLYQRFKRALSKAQVVILSDYLKGTLRRPEVFIQAARDANVPVLVDPKASNVSLYRHATWLTPNLKEFEAMAGDCPDEAAMVQQAKALLHRGSIEALLITRSEAGMSLITQDTVRHWPASSHEIYDVTGAGDTVISTLGAALAGGAAPEEAVSLANVAAGIAVTKLGATAVSFEELAAAYFGATLSLPSGIMQEAALVQAVEHARALRKKIVFTNGCYDILHVGHLRSLEMAKALGDYLIVAVNTDESVRALKGAARPIQCVMHRMALLAGLKVVDWVISFSDGTPNRLLHLLKPDVLAKGGDYHLDQVVGADIVRAYGGEVHVLRHGETVSSTEILNKIQTLSQEQALVMEEN